MEQIPKTEPETRYPRPMVETFKHSALNGMSPKHPFTSGFREPYGRHKCVRARGIEDTEETMSSK